MGAKEASLAPIGERTRERTPTCNREGRLAQQLTAQVTDGRDRGQTVVSGQSEGEAQLTFRQVIEGRREPDPPEGLVSADARQGDRATVLVGAAELWL